MIISTCKNTHRTHVDRPVSHTWQRFVDVHCHCLSGLDDGPVTMAESISLCRRLAEDGASTVVATPHQLGHFKDRNDAARVRQAVHHLNEALKDAGVRLAIRPGAEVYVDENICQLLADDTVLTLADSGKYLLLELPAQVSTDITGLLGELASRGVRCIMSHAERIAPFIARQWTLLGWLKYSAHLQITASSLLGVFGSRVRRIARDLLDLGLVSLVAADAHSTGSRRPRMSAAFDQITARLGEDTACLVCMKNPSRVICGRDIRVISQCSPREAV